MYYRFAFLYIGRVAVIMIVMFSVSFVGHSEIFTKAKLSQEQHLYNADKITLSNKRNIHVIMIDSLTNSAFSKEFLGIRSMAADYMGKLDNAIYAGHMGFVEEEPTLASWATLFALGQETKNTHAFSGRTRSPLTALLRKK